MFQAHDGPVNTCYASGVGVLTGGKDGRGFYEWKWKIWPLLT